ncbi:FliI/YscN family ATPase [Sphingorhabdus arenilitoris]|uniref:FliI/YscN family ATPase n=1 Tax=Sphingorhabdus arenilitoris TaxID=1490041 RepID=A0ABV8RCH6_9SPHN
MTERYMLQEAIINRIEKTTLVQHFGILQKIQSGWVEASGPNVPIGTICNIIPENGDAEMAVTAEVVKVDRDHIALVPFEDNSKLTVGARIYATALDAQVPVGDDFQGRAVDALAQAMDQRRLTPSDFVPLHPVLPSPMDRCSPRDILATGMRSIDGLLSLGVGQRIGVFAASGVGKTSLMTQLSKQIDCDHIIYCLIGERGREVEHLWQTELTEELRKKATIVAATSDKSAALRVRAVYQALALANYWRSNGRHVVLIIDSVTRLAMAMRETGLAAGEPPTVRAYTPGVFTAIPKIVESCGALKSGGAITAIMTILSETDDTEDPISEMMKSLLDGHIILSRKYAEKGHFPAIDICKSISRNMASVAEPNHMKNAREFLSHFALYDASQTMIDAGLYESGNNPDLDKAIKMRSAMISFLQQGQAEQCDIDDSLAKLQQIVRR